MKRALCLALAAGFLLTGAACGAEDSAAPSSKTEAAAVSSVVATASQKAASKSAPATSNPSSAASEIPADPAESYTAYADALAATNRLTRYGYSSTTVYGIIVDGRTVVLDSTKIDATGNGTDFSVTMTATVKDVHNKQLSSSLDALYACKADGVTRTLSRYTDFVDDSNNSSLKFNDEYQPVPLEELIDTAFAFKRADIGGVSRKGGDITFTLRDASAEAIVKRLFLTIAPQDDVDNVNVNYCVVNVLIENGCITSYLAEALCDIDGSTYDLQSAFTLETVSENTKVSPPDGV